MILSKRERYVGIGAIVVVGVLALDYYVLEPMLATRSQLEVETTKLQETRKAGLEQLKKKKDVDKRWADMTEKGGLQKDPESQIMHAVQQWAQDASLNITAIKPERTEQPKKDKPFQERVFRVTATGSMRTISNFLWRVQSTTTIPVRIADMQVSAKKEGVDDLTLQVGLSTIFWSPEYERPAKAAVSPIKEEK